MGHNGVINTTVYVIDPADPSLFEFIDWEVSAFSITSSSN